MTWISAGSNSERSLTDTFARDSPHLSPSPVRSWSSHDRRHHDSVGHADHRRRAVATRGRLTVTGTPISYATLSDLIQRCIEADEAMEVVARSGVGHVAWCHAAAAHDQIQS